jgi:hypothetical protein
MSQGIFELLQGQRHWNGTLGISFRPKNARPSIVRSSDDQLPRGVILTAAQITGNALL